MLRQHSQQPQIMQRHLFSLSCLERITILTFFKLFDNYSQTNLPTMKCLLNQQTHFIYEFTIY